MLETQRLLFRPYRISDFDFYLSLWQDPDVVQYIGNGHVKTKEELKQNFPYWLSKSELGKGVLVMLHRGTLKPIGHAGLVPQTVDDKDELEVGYWVSKRHWGRGYATEAAQLFSTIAFEQLGRKRIISIIQPANVRSVHVAQKIGMSLEKSTEFHGQHVHIYAKSTTS